MYILNEDGYYDRAVVTDWKAAFVQYTQSDIIVSVLQDHSN